MYVFCYYKKIVGTSFIRNYVYNTGKESRIDTQVFVILYGYNAGTLIKVRTLKLSIR